MPAGKYIVQQLDGYTDGRPSWRRVFAGYTPDKPSAETARMRLQSEHPTGKFRVRKVSRGKSR